MKRNSILIGAVLVVIVTFVVGMFAYQNYKGKGLADTATKNAASLVQFHSPTMGANDAKVTIVEFFDPSCETCRAFHPIVKSMLAQNPGKIRLVLRYAVFHKDSDIVVKMLEAAKTQGLFWQSLDAVLQSQPVWSEHGNPQVQRIWEFLQPVGLDIEKAKLDMENPRIVSILKQDMSDVATLKVEKTPTFYVNGKLLKNFGEDNLRSLVAEELKAHYP